MISIRKVSGIVIAFFLGAACTWLLLSSIKEGNNMSISSSNDSHAAYSTENIALKNKVRELEEENYQLINTISSTYSKSSHASLPTPAEPVNQAIQEELTAYKLNEISQALEEKIGDDLKGYALKISDNFDNEEKDTFWSEQEELKLRTAITQDTELSDIALKDVECKSSQCKISVFSGSIEQNQAIFEKLTKTINKHYQNSSYYSDPLEKDGVKSIYLKVM